VVTGQRVQRVVQVSGRRMGKAAAARELEELQPLEELERDLRRVYDVRRAQDWEALLRGRDAKDWA
jgi:hypothetical protein